MSDSHLHLSDSLVSYIRSVSPPEPDYLARLRAETAQDPLAVMQITPELGNFLGLLARMAGARRCLEVGVYTGYSSLSVARALPPEGKLIACDIHERWTSIARRYWREAGLDSKIELRLAPALETLNRLLAEGEAGRFDFAFIDADKGNYLAYYDRILPLLRPGGLIAVDNVLWHGRVADPAENDADTQAIRAFNAAVAADSRVHTCLLPIGDGVTLVLKK